MSLKVKLISVEGDQAEYADVIGTTGKLFIYPSEVYYHAEGSDSVQLVRRRVTYPGDTIRIATKLNNVFTFKKL